MQSIPAARSSILEILVIKLVEQQFCVRTTSIREIRGWTPVTPLPKTPYEMMGVLNPRGSVIPIIDLAVKLGMAPTRRLNAAPTSWRRWNR